MQNVQFEMGISETSSKAKVLTRLEIIVDPEAGCIVVVGNVSSLHDPKPPVVVRLDVLVWKIERLQGIEVGVERVRVHDEG